jgi:hypothetical protein
MAKRSRRGKSDMIVVHMDEFIGTLLKGAKEDKKNADTGKSMLTTGEKLRIADAVTKWIVAKNRLEDIDGSIGIDTLKQRLRGGTFVEDEADLGAPGSRFGRNISRAVALDRGGPEFDKLKRRLPDHGNGGTRGRGGDHGDPDAPPSGPRRGVVTGVVNDDEPDDDGDSEHGRL